MLKIEIIDGRAYLSTPYNPGFVEQIKALGGRWHGADKTWSVDARSIDQARAVMREVFGQDDRPTETVNVTVQMKKKLEEWHSAVFVFGRSIARASGRDSGASISDGVAFLEGKPNSGGSVKNWTTYIPEGARFVLYDVPVGALPAEKETDDLTWEVVAQAAPDDEVDRAALEYEKARLLKRVTEIDKLLEGWRVVAG